MNNYSDKELIDAVKKWQDLLRAKLEKENYKYQNKEAFPIKTTIKNIKKELRKQVKNTNTDWNIIWNQVVGQEIALLTKVKRWNNGFLEISVNNPILRSELDAFFKEALINSIKELIEDNKLIRGIKFISN